MRNKTFVVRMILLVICCMIVIFSLLFLNLKKVEKKDNKNLSNKLEPGDEKFMEENISKINIHINGTSYSATLEKNKTTEELIKKLPLEIEMKDLNRNEKYYYFDESFSSDSITVNQIQEGDIMLYGDNCLVLFYETFQTNYQYTRIGRIDNPDSLKKIVGNQTIKVLFEK